MNNTNDNQNSSNKSVGYGACVCVCVCFFFCSTPGAPGVSSFFFYTCLGYFYFYFYFTALHPACTCISTQQLVRMFIGGAWDKSCSSRIWGGKNADSTIENEWTDSGKWDGRKSVKVGNGMGSEWADSGTGNADT